MTMIGKKIRDTADSDEVSNWFVIVGEEDNVYILNFLDTYLNNDKRGVIGGLRIWTEFSREKFIVADV
jgi:hypothetical protein